MAEEEDAKSKTGRFEKIGYVGHGEGSDSGERKAVKGLEEAEEGSS